MKIAKWVKEGEDFYLEIYENFSYIGCYGYYYFSASKVNYLARFYNIYNEPTTRSFTSVVEARQWCEDLARNNGFIILTEQQVNLL